MAGSSKQWLVGRVAHFSCTDNRLDKISKHIKIHTAIRMLHKGHTSRKDEIQAELIKCIIGPVSQLLLFTVL